MKYLFLAIPMIMSSNLLNAQMTAHPMISVGYQHQTSNFAELGGKVLFLKNDDYLYRIGASAMIGELNDRLAVVPKIQGDFLINTQKQVDIHHACYIMTSAEATPQYIAPKLGLSLFGLIDLTGGYAFSYDKNGLHGKQIKGFNFNFTLSVPLVVFSKK